MDSFRILSGLNPDDYSARKIAVAMSGGVDSSLAASLLKETGFEVIGLTMSHRDYDSFGDRKNGAGYSDLSTAEDARKTALSLDIPHFTIDLREEFESLVVEDFVSEYLSGRTPNPCIRCNKFIKWHVLQNKARALGCELLATGHYARIARHDDGTFSLLSGVDVNKDQSYFLWGLDKEKLAVTLFPLGNMTKEETKKEARKRGLKSARRRESQEICFIPDNNYGRFLRDRFTNNSRFKIQDSRFKIQDSKFKNKNKNSQFTIHNSQFTIQNLPLALTEGDILTTSGTPVGRHKGSAYYTIGQRRGLGVAFGHPVYVTAVDTKTNTVTVGEEKDMLSFSMSVTDITWTRGFPPSDVFRCTTRIRYRHNGAPSEVKVSPDSTNVTFDTPQKAVTPGQSAVFYEGDVVLGGGVIEKAW